MTIGAGRCLLASSLHPQTVNWLGRLNKRGASMPPYLIRLADQVGRQLDSAGLIYSGAIIRLNLCIGNNLASACTPYIGTIADTAVGMSESDYSQSNGWTTDGTSKYINTNLVLGIQANNAVGFGAYLRTSQTNSSSIRNGLLGCQDSGASNLYRIVSNTNSAGVTTAGNVAAVASSANWCSTASTNLDAAFWHASRSGSTRLDLYRNGVSVANTVTSTTLLTTSPQTCLLGCIAGGGGPALFLSAGSKFANYVIDVGLGSTNAPKLYNILFNFNNTLNR